MPSRVDHAYEIIKGNILSNNWSPGYNAFEPEIAAHLNMSRTPVREALVRLEREGLIRIVPRRGIYVSPISASDVRDIYHILASLEATAAELIARNERAPDLLAGMREAVDDMDRALAANDLNAWAGGDEIFHRLLVNNSGNVRLAQIVSMINDQAHRARMITLRLRPFPSSSNVEHKAIVCAIENNRWEIASQLVREHRIKGIGMVTDALDKFHLKKI